MLRSADPDWRADRASADHLASPGPRTRVRKRVTVICRIRDSNAGAVKAADSRRLSTGDPVALLLAMQRRRQGTTTTKPSRQPDSQAGTSKEHTWPTDERPPQQNASRSEPIGEPDVVRSQYERCVLAHSCYSHGVSKSLTRLFPLTRTPHALLSGAEHESAVSLWRGGLGLGPISVCRCSSSASGGEQRRIEDANAKRCAVSRPYVVDS